MQNAPLLDPRDAKKSSIAPAKRELQTCDAYLGLDSDDNAQPVPDFSTFPRAKGKDQFFVFVFFFFSAFLFFFFFVSFFFFFFFLFLLPTSPSICARPLGECGNYAR